MKRLFVFVMAIMLLCAAFPCPGQADQVTIATLNWEPYIGKDLPQNGFLAEIITESFARKGHQVTFQVYPWARTVKLAEAGKVDAYGPEYYAEDLTKTYRFSDPMPGGPAGLFRLKGSGIDYQTLEDLKSYSIGVVRGYVNEEKFDQADFLKKQEADSDLTNIKKLLAKRIDLFFADEYVGKWLAKSNGLEASQLDFIKPMVTHDLYLCFPIKNANSEKLVADFNAGLKEIKSDGTLEKIMNNRGF